MSREQSPVRASVPDQAPASDSPLPIRKSYRRKYRKIMVKFEEKMRESNTLFRDEQRIFDISQRLAEQTDQILDLLLELNSQPHVPKRMRYDLSHPTAPKRTRSHQDIETGFEMLRKARNQVSKRELSQTEYQNLEKELLDSTEFAPERSYASYVASGIAQKENTDDNELVNPLAGGLLTAKQEELYLNSLDAFLEGDNPNPRNHVTGNLGHRGGDKTNEREREFQLRNPVSVYNWLRKHQPQVFLQDGDHEKSKVGSRSSKRNTISKDSKRDHDLYDDDGIAVETNSSSRGKRKRDEDGGYRPKGGHARPSKRKRLEEGGRRSKRASMDISAS